MLRVDEALNVQNQSNSNLR